MLRQFSLRRRIALIIWDWLGTITALYVGTFIKREIDLGIESVSSHFDIRRIISFSGDWPAELLPFQVFIIVALIWPFFLFVYSSYNGSKSFNRRTELSNVLKAASTSLLVLAGVLFFSFRDTSRLLIGLFFVLDLTFLIGGRLVFYFLRTIWKNNGRANTNSVMIIGAGEAGIRVAEQLRKYSGDKVALVGFLDDNPALQGKQIANLPVLGNIEALDDIKNIPQFQNAIVTLPLRAHKRLVEVATRLHHHNLNVHIVPDLFALSFPNASLDGFGGIPVINLGQPGIQGGRRIIKRVFDLMLSLVLLILLSPLLLLIAVFIKRDSPGQVIFKQTRVGENGKPFEFLKFRSMAADTDQNLHKNYVTELIQENVSPNDESGSLKIAVDPRVTKLGIFLRKFSLDELPQLINVVRGDMSLVGPRPPIPYEVEVYKAWHKRRFDVPPGMTGLWQVVARNQVSFDEMVRLDLEYIDNYSLWLDIKLLLRTPWAVVRGKGAG